MSELSRQWHRIGLAVAALAFATTVYWPAVASAGERSQAAVRAFRAENPCPLTGDTAGPCRAGGERMVVDHVIPLCLGGADAAGNMQWQEYRQSREKDRVEVALCRWIRKARR